MSWLKNLRESTGLAQWEMANLLNINRSAINMVERGERELPREANIRLLQIVSAMHALKGEVSLHETLPETKQYLAEKLEKEAAWLRLKMYPLQKKMAEQEAKYKTSDQLLLMLTALKQLHQTDSPKEGEIDWLEYKQKVYNRTGKDKRLWQLQQLRLFSLEAQATEMERLAKEMKG